jgi:hypothetical protein
MRLRRFPWFVAIFFALLALPALVQLASPPPTTLGTENRRPAPPPTWPRHVADVPALPAQVDAWLADRFGLRAPLVRLNTWLHWHLLGEIDSPRIVIGRHGRLFMAAADGAAPNTLITVACGADAPESLVARSAAALRATIQEVRQAGFDPTLLLVPTAARLHAQDLPPALAATCAGHAPLGDAVVARLGDLPVVYPLAIMQRAGGIPPHRFHWAGTAPRLVAEDLATRRWGRPLDFTLPFARKSRGSDLNPLSPGLGLSDMVEEPQTAAAGVWSCWMTACAGAAGLPPEAALALTGYRRPGTGRLLIVGDSFTDDIVPAFIESFAEVWCVHTNTTQQMSLAARQTLAAWLQERFRGGRLLLVLHDMGATTPFDRIVADALTPAGSPHD